MATLPGGTTVATIGTTQQENTQITTVLSSQFASAPIATNVASTPTVATPIVETIGTFVATAVTTTTVTPTSAGSIVVVEMPTSATSVAGSVNNLVVNQNVGALIFQNSSSNSLTGVLLGDSSSKTTLVVGNAGSSLIDGSQSIQNLTIVAGTGSDTIVSGTGNDAVTLGEFGIVNGGAGADTLIGGTGTATLGGGVGSDSIVAASGGGAIIGEVGNDTLVAGAGKDVFIYRSGDGSDNLVGFNPAQDTLGLAIAGVDIQSLINNATVVGGNTIITMADGATITLAGVTGINVNWFTPK